MKHLKLYLTKEDFIKTLKAQESEVQSFVYHKVETQDDVEFIYGTGNRDVYTIDKYVGGAFKFDNYVLYGLYHANVKVNLVDFIEEEKKIEYGNAISSLEEIYEQYQISSSYEINFDENTFSLSKTSFEGKKRLK